MRIQKRVKETFKVPNDPDDGWVEIKHLKINEVKKIESAVNEMSYSTGGSVSAVNMKMNPYQRNRELAIACLVGWGNMFDVLGKPMPFNKKNIDSAAEFEIHVLNDKDGTTDELDFFEWVDKCRNELSDRVKAEQVRAEEN